MKIALVNPHLNSSMAAIPHGLLSIASTTRHAGFACDLFDQNVQNVTVETLKKYDVVGFSVMTAQLKAAVPLADQLAKHCKIVWGGIHALLDPSSLLKRYPESLVILGEGEYPLVNLLQSFAKGEEKPHGLPGVMLLDQGIATPATPFMMDNLDNVPDADYGLLPQIEKYIVTEDTFTRRTSRRLTILTGRGCVWNCSFCIHSVFHRMHHKPRKKSITKIKRECQSWVRNLKIDILDPSDDDFFGDQNLVRDWCQFARETGFRWAGNCRFNYFGDKFITPEYLREMQQSGCYALFMSIEAGDEKTRNRILHKGVRDRDIERTIDIIHKSGIDMAVGTSFITHFPGDTLQNRIATIKMMDYLSRRLNIIFSGPQVYRAYPGSRLYDLDPSTRSDLTMDDYLQSDGDEQFFSSMNSQVSQHEENFFSRGLIGLFNCRFRFLEHAGTPNNSWKRKLICRWLIRILFLPILLRLRFDYWKFFIEYRLIGWIISMGINYK